MPWASSRTTAAKTITSVTVSRSFPSKFLTARADVITSQSGPISKSPIWTFGVPQLIPHTLTTWKHRAVFIMRFVPVCHLCRRVFTCHTIHQRWGDAPVHSIGAALFAHKDQIHFFDEIGYEHAPYQHCPREKKSWENARCGCNPGRSFGEWHGILMIVSD